MSEFHLQEADTKLLYHGASICFHYFSLMDFPTRYRLQLLNQWIGKNEQTLILVNGFHFPRTSPKSQFQ